MLQRHDTESGRGIETKKTKKKNAASRCAQFGSEMRRELLLILAGEITGSASRAIKNEHAGLLELLPHDRKSGVK